VIVVDCNVIACFCISSQKFIDDVFELASGSGCTGYDCEYIELAKRHNPKLVTADAKLI
jgi:predicted nucleic acid-binding protein